MSVENFDEEITTVEALAYFNRVSTPEELVDQFREDEKEHLSLSAARSILAKRAETGTGRFDTIEQILAAVTARTDFSNRLKSIFEPIPKHSYPVLALPMRIETKLVKNNLLIRWYPDQIAIDNHNPKLSSNEVKSATTWALSLQGTAQAAWRRLSMHHGPTRAAWIKRLAESTDDVESLKPRKAGEAKPSTLPTLPSSFRVYVYGREQNRDKILYKEKVSVSRPLTLPYPNKSDRDHDNSGWFHDFSTAVKDGMGVSIELTEEDQEFRDKHSEKVLFSRIMVVGLRNTNALAGQALVEGLLESHIYTDGLEFLAPGTPTHNTSSVNAAHSAKERKHEDAYVLQQQTPQGWGDGLCAGERMATFLGINTELFRTVAGAGDRRESHSRDLHWAIWPATGDYMLARMLHSEAKEFQDLRLSIPARRQLWQRFRQYVRPAGPLPALRVGRTIYGVLPAYNLSDWRVSSGAQNINKLLPQFLSRARARWKDRVHDSKLIPRVGVDSDTDGELLRVLAMGAISHILLKRVFIQVDTLYQTIAQAIDITDAALGAILSSFQLTANHPRFEDLNSILALPTAQEIFHWMGQMPLLRSVSVGPLLEIKQKIAAANGSDLIRMCDHSHSSSRKTLLEVLIELSRVRIRLTPRQPDTPTWLELKALNDAVCRLADLFRPRIPLLPTQSGSSFPIKHTQLGNGLTSMTTKPTTLDSPPKPDMDRLLREGIDALSHRLDAWVTSLATERILQIRGNPTYKNGLYVGAYGWVEDFTPRTHILSHGFFHSPSPDHGAVGAVFYNAFLGYAGAEENPYHINLSSTRVRHAVRMLDAIREGHEIGAFLGCAFQGALRESTPPLDRFIDELRNTFPLVANHITKTAAKSSEISPPLHIAARNVVDGRKLLLAWLQASRNWETFSQALPILQALESEEKDALTLALEHLVMLRDASSDLLMQEALYQTARGNHERASAALDAMSGKGRPPELECVKTLITGPRLSHRVCLVLPEFDPDVHTRCSPRERSEPRLGAWMRSVLGDLAEVQCEVTYARTDQAEPTKTRLVSLDDLGLTPLDVLYLGSTTPGADTEQTEIERRVALYVRQQDPAAVYDYDKPMNITLGRSTTLQGKTFADALAFADILRTLLGDGAFLRPRSLARATHVSDAAFSLNDVQAIRAERIEPALNDLRWIAKVLNFHEPATPKYPEAEGSLACRESVVVEALMLASCFGISSAIPDGPMDPKLDDRRIAVRAEILQRVRNCCKYLTELDTLVADFNSNTPQKPRTSSMIAKLIQAAHVIFGPAFFLVPEFSPAAPDVLAQQWNAPATRKNVDSQRVMLWLQKLSQVRPPMANIERVLLFLEAWASESKDTVPTTQQLSFQIAQFLPEAGTSAPWLALDDEERGETTRPRHALCIEALTPNEFNAQPPARVAGFLIDQWHELVPTKEATTNLTFHYDRPGSQAPNCLLLAVPSKVDDRPWKLDKLRDVVQDTFALAKERLVDREAAPDLAGALPAIFLPQ